MEKLKIFISGTQDDMQPERDAVDRAVSSTTLSTGIRAETAVSQLKPPRAWIEQQIRECNIYIGVYSHRYGWVIPDENVSATEFEFNLARKLQKPILVWIRNLQEGEKTKPDFDRQEQFLDRVSDFSVGHLRQVFDKPNDLEKWVAAALGEMFTEIIRRGTAPGTGKFLVPFAHNPDFVGRETELSSLHEMLQQRKSIVGIRPTVLVGLGGIGKTQLAVEYAHAHRDDYPSGVFWLNAINPLLFEFSDLAEKLEMADRDTPRDQAARKVWDYLDLHPDALVIFDNVLEPSELNVPFSPDLVPANLRCRTLFTTRQRDFPRTFQPFEVKVLPELAAMRLLLRARPEVLEEHHPEWGWARIVCASLGWLPLALELSAAFLGAYPEVSITGYLERLRTEGSLETVDESEVRAVDLPTRVEEILKAAAAGNLEIKHQVAVSATLQTQWKRLDDEEARLLFRAAGQFPEASWIPIPRLSLLTGIESKAKAGRPSPLNVVLKKLYAVSLIEELSDDRLRLHPLVQEFAARLSPASFRLEMAERVVAEFNDLKRLQACVIHYGVDMALEDIRTALGFCTSKSDSETYTRLSSLERVLDRQAHYLRGWNAEMQPAFFLQQLCNESFELDLSELKACIGAELGELGLPYLCERFKVRRESPELVRTLTGHSDKVAGVALSADGRLAVSASWDKTLKVWDVATGRELRTLTGHSDKVAGVALSADGRLAVSASWDKTLKVWDVATGRELRTFQGHGAAVWGVAITSDGRLAVSAALEKTLKVWDVATGRELRSLKGQASEELSVAVTPDGLLAVSGDNYGILKVWDLPTGQELRTLKGHPGSVDSMAVTSDGRLAISSSDDRFCKNNTLKVWDLSTGQELRTLKGHTDQAHGVAVTPDGLLAVSGDSNGMLKVWDLATGQELRTLKGHTNRVDSVAVTPAGWLAVSASWDNTLKVWDLATDREHRTFTGHTDQVQGVLVTPDGRLAVSASWDKTLKVWDLATGQELRTLKGHTSWVWAVAVTPDGRLAVSASEDNTLKVWDLATGRELHTLKGHTKGVRGVALGADGRLAISASLDKTLKVWDVVTGCELRTLTGHSDDVEGVAVTPDGRLAVSTSWDKTLKVWDLATGQELRTLKGHTSWVCDVAVTPDGRLAVSGDNSGTLKVWDLSTGQEFHTLKGHTDQVHGVAVTPDGRLAVSVSLDKTLKVWDVATGQVVSTLPTSACLYRCAIAPDGKTIVAGDYVGVVHFLEWVKFEETKKS
jgi:WD40 repeat protein